MEFNYLFEIDDDTLPKSSNKPIVNDKKSKNIYDEKELFVLTHLKTLLLKIDKTILNVYYYHDSKTNEEFVSVSFWSTKPKCPTCDCLKINVTGDSLLSLTKDVLKRL